MTIGEKFVRYRAMHKLTQKQFGELLGLGTNTIHRAEKGGVNMHKAHKVRLEILFDKLLESRGETGEEWH